MKRITKRCLSVLLAIVLCLSVFLGIGGTARAEENENVAETTSTVVSNIETTEQVSTSIKEESSTTEQISTSGKEETSTVQEVKSTTKIEEVTTEKQTGGTTKSTKPVVRKQLRVASAADNMTAKELASDIKVGWNLGNTLDMRDGQNQDVDTSYYETLAKNPVTTKAMIDKVKQEGFNAVRLPITWQDHLYMEDSNGNKIKDFDILSMSPDDIKNIKIEDNWMNRIEEVVNYVLQNDMYCIINVHHDTGTYKDEKHRPIIYASTDANKQARYEAILGMLWSNIADRFKDYNNKLLYEGYNEIMIEGATTWVSSLKSEVTKAHFQAANALNEVFINTIRKSSGNNVNRFLIANTYGAEATSRALSNFTLPNDNRVLMSVHMYDWNQDWTSNQALYKTLLRIKNKADELGTAAIIGECGIRLDTAGDDKASLSLNYLTKEARELGIPCFYWDDGGSWFILLNRKGLSFDYNHPKVADAFINGASGIGVDQSYVSGLKITSMIDGTLPFDSDDKIGNDSSDSNNIVRSFDYINYMLEYSTALRDMSQLVDEANLMVRFELDCDTSEAEFNKDTLNWCSDKKITYTFSDGTEGTSLNGKKAVKQVLTGKKLLSKDANGKNEIPGVATLSVGLRVKAAPNGAVMKPKFSLWMEGNEESLHKTVESSEVKVTAAPRYNVKLSKNSECNELGYFDFASGTISSSDKEGTKYGRLEGYTLNVQVYNDSADKGLKGIELPKGDLKFDIELKENLGGVQDVTFKDDFQPLLWDYRENNYIDGEIKGTLGRQMTILNRIANAYGIWYAPLNKGTIRSACCYNGGNFSISQDENQSNLYHVTLKDYRFDTANFKFPTINWGGEVRNPVYKSNIGCFSVGYIQILAQFARTVDKTEDLYFRVEAKNLDATSLSDQKTYEDQNPDDNVHGMNVPLYPRGTISKRNFFLDKWGNNLASVWRDGDSYASLGQEIMISSGLDYNGGDDYLTAANILQKFDDEAFDVPDGTDMFKDYSLANPASEIGSIDVLFAAKPDKTGWTNDAEMEKAREENLVYFENIDDLKAAGYVCIGVLYEVRDSKLYRGISDGSCLSLRLQVDVKQSAEINAVYQTTNSARAWRATGGEVNSFSWKDATYNETEKSFGLGDVNWEKGAYIENYTKPNFTLYTYYGKTVYKDGSIVSGHSGGYVAGNSLLITGCKGKIDIQIADMVSQDEKKAIYDLDSGERTVNYVIHPSVEISSANSSATDTEMTTNVTIKVILPKGLTYIMDSASLAPEGIKDNADGTSTITWYIENQKVGAAMDAIKLACTIGKAGTAEDVHNNDTLTISSSITCDKDGRAVTVKNGNYSETTISVVLLSSYSISKSVDKNLVEEGKDIIYTLHYGNSSGSPANNVSMLDVLPYNKDNRGTTYHGGYVVKSIVLNFDNAPKTFAEVKNSVKVSSTKNTVVRDNVSAVLKSGMDVGFGVIGGAVIEGNNIVYRNLSMKDVAALYVELMKVEPREYLDIDITLSPVDGAGNPIKDGTGSIQIPGDLYSNTFHQYADNQVEVLDSNVVKVQIVERALSGLAWLDENVNGIREDAEKAIPNATVKLYRSTKSEYANNSDQTIAINGMILYPAYDVFGSAIKEAKTDSNGKYLFEYLEAGTYYVVIEVAADYRVTDKNIGDDDTKDSDAIGVYDSADSLQAAYIENIKLPEVNAMASYKVVSEHNDAGYYNKRYVIKLLKESTDGTRLEGASFTLYSDKNLTNEVDSIVSSEDGTASFKELKEGVYYILETVAPKGYRVLDKPIMIELSKETVKVDGINCTTDSESDAYIQNGGNGVTELHLTVFNKKGMQLPDTGGYVILLFMLSVAICMSSFLIKRMKKE